MKKIISMILTLCMLATMVGSITVTAATNDGAMDFDTETAPTFTVTGEGTANELHKYVEDGIAIQGRVSHPAHSWSFQKDVFGKPGYSILGKGAKNVEKTETQGDPCLIGFVDVPTSTYATSTDQYYNFEFDVAFDGNNSFELLAITDNGDTIVLLSAGTGVNKGIYSDALLHNKNVFYTAYAKSWHKIKVVIKSADVTNKEGDAKDTAAENTHQYWIYANGNLVKSGTTNIKIRNKTEYLGSFAGLKTLQFRGYGIADSSNNTTGDWEMGLDNIKAYTTDALPVADWEGSMDFDTLTESSDIAAINQEIFNTQIGYFLSGAATSNSLTWIRNTTKGLASVEGGVFGKDASDKSISLSLDGNQTDGTNFLQITQAGQGMNTMQRMSKGDYYEFQTSMAWAPDAKIIGVQGFYSNTASDDGKGQMLLNVSPATGLITVLGVRASDTLKLVPNTWYKFNIVVHSGDVNAENDADKNWYTLYVNDTLVAEKVVFTPSIRKGTQPTFLGVDQYWFQVGVGSAKESGKAYYDDIKIKYSTSEKTYSPVTISTTDEYAIKYNGEAGINPVCGYSYIDERVSLDAEKWSVSDGTISFVSNQIGENNYAKITRADGSNIYYNFKNANEVKASKQFAQNSNPTAEFNYASKDFTTYTFPSAVAGRSADDYSFKMESIGVYDNWVMTIDADGNATTAEYQKDPANWVNKDDIPKDTKATYAFRDSFNPFVQLYPNTHFAELDYTKAWTANLSLLADGEYNTVDFQVISNDNGGRVTMNLIALNKAKGTIYIDKYDTGVPYNSNQWLNFVVNVYPATKEITVYYQGEMIYDGEFNFPWERFARIKVQNAICHSGYSNHKARNSKVVVDDLQFIQGSRYVPATLIPAMAECEGINSEFIANGVIITDGNETVEELKSHITGGSVEVYQDKSCAQVATGNIALGNVVVIKSADGSIYKYIYIADTTKEANAELAFTQSYQIGLNSYAPIYYADNVVTGKLIAAAYAGNALVECKYVDIENATYSYNGNALVMKPGKRVEFTAPENTTNVSIFLWKDLASAKPIAKESACLLKVVEE